MEGLKQLGSFNTVEASINGELNNPKLSRCRWSGGVSSKWCDASRPLFCFGGLEPCFFFLIFPFSWECHHPN